MRRTAGSQNARNKPRGRAKSAGCQFRASAGWMPTRMPYLPFLRCFLLKIAASAGRQTANHPQYIQENPRTTGKPGALVLMFRFHYVLWRVTQSVVPESRQPFQPGPVEVRPVRAELCTQGVDIRTGEDFAGRIHQGLLLAAYFRIGSACRA